MRSRILTIIMFALILLAILLFLQMRRQQEAQGSGAHVGTMRITRITA